MIERHAERSDQNGIARLARIEEGRSAEAEASLHHESVGKEEWMRTNRSIRCR